MRPGPPPLPLQLKILRGNPGKRTLPKRTAAPKPGAPCPAWLSDGAKPHWRRLAPMLLRLGLLTEADQSALACLCEALYDLEWANREIAKEGRTQMGSTGTTVAHPAVLIARQAREHVRKFGAEFGLTPATRSRAATFGRETDPEGDDVFLGPRPAPAPPPASKGRTTRKRAS
jgi:P27 family predicted phage terminase small subunit